MGTDPKTFVVDSSRRVHGTKNLYLSVFSVFPSSSSANPSFTIMAPSVFSPAKKIRILG
ncbi:GMC oxidoreductase [Leptospira stimsonii]|uniref:Glucose-methanol-choline oxidoreductase C-terminal domain-containing protein n=1 Tax=Leptospira stimsonii TaxID=2202203 RepID=A0A396Z7E6_9LEPT|nr:hypothetical protein DLM75_11675 [Leptospira stimsonii]